MLQDFRFGARMLLKQPGFTAIAVITLALGIGATSAVFSLIEGVLLTPPPYRQPDRLILISSARTDGQLAANAPPVVRGAMAGMAKVGGFHGGNSSLWLDVQLPRPI